MRGGLDNCRYRFEHAKTGRVAFLGGSITEGGLWRELVCKDLQKRFPQTKFDFINAGISSTGSTPGAFRLLRDVFSRGPVDLLFEEAAVNDDTNGFSDQAQIRGMEGIVRHARLLQPEIDIVMLHFVDPGKMVLINQGKTPAVIANHEKVAALYQVASIDLAREVTERIRAGEFTWEKDFRDLHPAPFGHALYARSVGRLLDAAWQKPLAADAKVDAASAAAGTARSQKLFPRPAGRYQRCEARERLENRGGMETERSSRHEKRLCRCADARGRRARGNTEAEVFGNGRRNLCRRRTGCGHGRV